MKFLLCIRVYMRGVPESVGNISGVTSAHLNNKRMPYLTLFSSYVAPKIFPVYSGTPCVYKL